MPKTLDAMHMSENRDYEPQRTNHFEVQIVNVGDETDVTMAVLSSPFPTISNDPIEVPYANTNVKFPGQTTFDDIDIELRDFIGAEIAQTMYDWRQEVFDIESGEMGFAADFKRRGYQYEYAPDGTHLRTWVLEGIWPNSVDYGEGNYDGSDAKNVTVTLSVDRAYRE